MFLLVPAHPGFPGQIPQSRKTVVCVCVMCLLIKATILEEMPPFPERESSILAKLKKKRPDKVANNTIEPRGLNATAAADGDTTQPSAPVSFV